MYYSDKTIPFAPILKPTEKEFKNFKSYIYKVYQDPKYANAGCLKVT